MTLEQGYFISQIIAAVGLVASIIFLALQVRQNNFILQRTMNEDFRNTMNTMWHDVAKDREYAEFHMRLGYDYQSLDKVDKYRALFLAQHNVSNIMRSVQARLAGHVSDAEWLAVRQRIRMAGTREGVIDAWSRIKDSYPEDAQRLWDQDFKNPHDILK